MPRISREEIGDQSSRAASRWRALMNSNSPSERASAEAELIASRFWQSLASTPEDGQTHFDESIEEWKGFCESHKNDPVPPNFLYLESQVRSIETMLSLDVSSYDILAEEIEQAQIATEVENQNREREQLASVHNSMPTEDPQDESDSEETEEPEKNLIAVSQIVPEPSPMKPDQIRGNKGNPNNRK